MKLSESRLQGFSIAAARSSLGRSIGGDNRGWLDGELLLPVEVCDVPLGGTSRATPAVSAEHAPASVAAPRSIVTIPRHRLVTILYATLLFRQKQRCRHACTHQNSAAAFLASQLEFADTSKKRRCAFDPRRRSPTQHTRYSHPSPGARANWRFPLTE